MTLRSGQNLKESRKSRDVEQEIEVNELEPHQDQDITSNTKEISENKNEHYMPLVPFSSRLRETIPNVDKVNQEILETFRKVEINMPIQESIKQVTCYAKFLEELCTTKSKLKGNKKMCLLFFKRSFTLNIRL